jgi:hypothetical protein
MLWHIIAIAVSGLGAAGIGLFLRFLSRKKLPRWIIPVFAGAGMLAYQVHFEYSWFELKQTQLPAGSVVVSSESPNQVWRPWTMVYPMTNAFTVVDTRNLVRQEQEGDTIARFVLYRFEKQHIDQVTFQTYLLNCTTTELVPLTERGEVQINDIRTLNQGNRLLSETCNPD